MDVFKQGEVSIDNRIHIINDDGDIISTFEQPENNEEQGNGINQQQLDDWLPITRSRRGNSWTATFHLLSSGIGIQTLSLPLAFVYLGWFVLSVRANKFYVQKGLISNISVAFIWQLYTIGLLVSLHECVPGTRYSRYLQLSMAAFGVKLGKVLALFPVMYLSGGTCVMFIITGGGIMKRFYQLVCEDFSSKHSLTTTEWFLVFVCLAILVSLCCPNLHSVALVSFLGAIMAVGYCTVLWVVLVSKGRVENTIYNPSKAATTDASQIRNILNALGIIAVAFRGHNVVLEIQGTISSTPTRSSSKFMMKGVVASHLIIAMCFFPLGIVGYWAFGNTISTNGGLLTAISTTLHHKASKPVLGLIYMQVLISCVAAFQIYGMVVYDNLERAYSSRTSQECSKLIRMGIRIFFGGFTFFISVAFPFLPSLSLLIGGIVLHLTFGYPSLMWIAIKRPPMASGRWWLNFVLGCLGTGLSVLVVVSAVWNLVYKGLDANFFHPR